jgi:diguanylate cyclase (GGDEF)-like protein
VFLAGVFLSLVLLSFWATGSVYFLIPLIPYSALSLSFYFLNRYYEGEILANEIEVEKNLVEQNELQHVFGEYLMRSRALQNKYLNYYNLRKGIEDLTTQFSLEKLSRLITAEVYEFLKKGDRVLLLLGSGEGGKLSIVATRSLDSEEKADLSEGDFFDHWAHKNRQPLLINDLEKDFRFNVKRETLREPFESAMIVPLSLESEGGGVLRVNSSKKNNFSVDDMRILQILSDIASTALLNCYLFSKTEELAIKDSLTGLFVHRYFRERLEEECRRVWAGKSRRFALLFLDLDHFKEFNDKYGHSSGDIALFEVGRLIRKEIDAKGLVARYGGEEFAVILFETGAEDAFSTAERLRRGIGSTSIEIRGVKHKLTISCGLAEFSGKESNEEALIQKADEALYRAKNQGRDRVCS